MICRFQKVTVKHPGPLNEWAKMRYQTGGDVSHFGFVSDMGNMVWVFPTREDGKRVALLFDLEGTVQQTFELCYSDHELTKGYKLLK